MLRNKWGRANLDSLKHFFPVEFYLRVWENVSVRPTLQCVLSLQNNVTLLTEGFNWFKIFQIFTRRFARSFSPCSMTTNKTLHPLILTSAKSYICQLMRFTYEQMNSHNFDLLELYVFCPWVSSKVEPPCENFLHLHLTNQPRTFQKYVCHMYVVTLIFKSHLF